VWSLEDYDFKPTESERNQKIVTRVTNQTVMMIW